MNSLLFDIYIWIFLSTVVLWYILLVWFTSGNSSFKYLISLIWLFFLMFFLLVSSDVFVISCFLLINSFLSFYVILIDNFSNDSGTFNSLFFNILSEVFLLMFIGLFYFLGSGRFMGEGVLYFSSDVVIILLMVVIMIYSLIGCFSFWIYWVMSTSCFVSIYFHSCGVILVGCYMFKNIVSSGLLNISEVDIILTFLGVVSLMGYWFFLCCYFFASDAKSSLGCLSASSVSHLFMVSIYYGNLYGFLFFLLSLSKVFLFDLLNSYGDSFYDSLRVSYLISTVLFFLLILLEVVVVEKFAGWGGTGDILLPDFFCICMAVLNYLKSCISTLRFIVIMYNCLSSVVILFSYLWTIVVGWFDNETFNQEDLFCLSVNVIGSLLSSDPFNILIFIVFHLVFFYFTFLFFLLFNVNNLVGAFILWFVFRVVTSIAFFFSSILFILDFWKSRYYSIYFNIFNLFYPNWEGYSYGSMKNNSDFFNVVSSIDNYLFCFYLNFTNYIFFNFSFYDLLLGVLIVFIIFFIFF